MNLLSVWTIIVFLLFLKMVLNSGVQAASRLKTGIYRYRDDASFFGRGKGKSSLELSELDSIAHHVWRNDLENNLIFLFISLSFVLNNGPVNYLAAYGALFVIARYMHAIFMYFPRQPYRNICYQVANLSSVITILHSMYLALT